MVFLLAVYLVGKCNISAKNYGWPVNCQTVKSQSAKSQAVKSQWTKSQSVKSQWTKSQAAKSQSAKSQSICQKPSSQKPISQKPTYKMFQLKALHMPIVFSHILMTWLCSILLYTGCLLSNAEFRYMYNTYLIAFQFFVQPRFFSSSKWN